MLFLVRRMKKYYLTFFIISILGCAGTHPVTQIKTIDSESYSIPDYNNLVFRQSKNETWNNILNKLSSSKILTISEIDNNSQHVTATFDVQPNKYLDCGSRIIQSNNHSLEVVNAHDHYKYSSYRRNHLDTYYIRNKLTGIINIFLNGNEITSTAIVQIVFTLNVLEVRRSTQGGRNRHQDYSLTLNPNEVKYFDIFNASCRSTGKLEMQIKTLLEG